MKVLDPGHLYELSHLDGDKTQKLQFVRRGRHNDDTLDIEGVTNQEVLRVLIDRIEFLDKQKPHSFNTAILHALRQAFLLHELRALDQKLLKDELQPEKIVCGNDGHFKLEVK